MKTPICIWAAFFAAVLTVICNGRAAAQIDTKFIPDSAVGAIVAYPQHAASLEGMELFPHEIVTAFGEKEFGMDPMKISQLILMVDHLDFESQPQWGGIVRFSEMQIVGGKFFRYAERGEFINGMKAYNDGMGFVVVEADKQTFLFGTKKFVANMVDARGESPLKTMLAVEPSQDKVHAYLAFSPMRDQVKSMLTEMGEIPQPFQKFTKLPDLIESLHLSQELNAELSSTLTITSAPGESEKLNELLQSGLRMGKEMILTEMSNQMDLDDPVQKATVKYLYRLGEHIEKQLQPAVEGDQLVYQGNQGVAAAPVLVALLLPAVQQVRGAARRTDSANRLRQLMLAMHNFHDSNKKLPTNIYDQDGNALLSWRVQILPYIEEGALYDEFRLDEPWDSEHNIQLIERMPETLKSSIFVTPPGRTVFLGVAGEHMTFNGPRRVTLETIRDGTSRTIGLVEADADRAVIWTQPADLTVDPDFPMDGLGNLLGEGGGSGPGFNAAFLDGSVQFITNTIDEETLLNLFQTDDGNVVYDHGAGRYERPAASKKQRVGTKKRATDKKK